MVALLAVLHTAFYAGLADAAAQVPPAPAAGASTAGAGPAASAAASAAASPVATAPPVALPPPAATAPPAAASAAPRARIETRSSDLLAVGTVRGDRMTIRLSRVVDNAPVGNAVLAVMLRGSTHPAIADADGSYSVDTPDLSLAGPATVEFLVTVGAEREELKGTLEDVEAMAHSAKSSSRQLGWWVLNFAVCIGFLWLWSRRKSADT